MSKVNKGIPWPLGSKITKRGVNFSIAAPDASHIELLIFADPNADRPSQIIELNKEFRSGDYWHIEVEGLKQGCCYNYRVFGNHEKSDSIFYPNKVLLDPCAREIEGWEIYERGLASGSLSNLNKCLKSVVSERDFFDFDSHPRPKHSLQKSIIYELHVGGFTNDAKSNVEGKYKGTFLGLIEKIPYLKKLGITTIELLPVFAFDNSDSQKGLENYWGYSPLNWFTPHQSYISKEHPLSAREQVRKFVASCHDNDLEVLLDVVYNHTTEGNQQGPIISWKGFGEDLYYHKNEKGDYLDVTGCGNSVAANRPLVRKLILESMRCWAIELGVDGFRFDLGIALTRGEQLTPLMSPPLFEEIEADPFLNDLKLISEPWDCGGLYKLADFPSKRIGTWNGHFRDDIRKFWREDRDSTWKLKERLMGSQDLYKNKKPIDHSINFITAHDGFTLFDLISYEIKHNLANGENNRDGDNNNHSSNNGVEGPSTSINIHSIRKRQQRNLLSSLILSPGVPMLSMGDEVGRSQGGNNNSWCQNNSLGWMIWDPLKCDLHLHKFVGNLLKIRTTFPDLFSPKEFFSENQNISLRNEESIWVEWHGVKQKKPDWGHWSHTLGYSIHKGNKGAALWMGFNAYSKSMTFELPQAISKWSEVINTKNDDISTRQINLPIPNQNHIELQKKTFVLALSLEYSKKLYLD